MHSIIRRWQLDYSRQQWRFFGPIYGLLIGAKRVTVFQMIYNADKDVYECSVFLEKNEEGTQNAQSFTLSTDANDVVASVNIALTIMRVSLAQQDPGKKKQGRKPTLAEDSPSMVESATETPGTDRKSAKAKRENNNKSPTRLSDNSYINSSTTDNSIEENFSQLSINSSGDKKGNKKRCIDEKGLDKSHHSEDDDDSSYDDNDTKRDQHNNENKIVRIQGQVQPTNSNPAPKGTTTTTEQTKQRRHIDVENMYPLDSEVNLDINTFIVQAVPTTYARKLYVHNNRKEKYLAKVTNAIINYVTVCNVSLQVGSGTKNISSGRSARTSPSWPW